jgi:hypothetical protein
MDIRSEAGSLRNELGRELGVTPKIRMGGPGQLDVVVDGKVVFSKKTAKRMPQPGEVVRLVRRPAP